MGMNQGKGGKREKLEEEEEMMTLLTKFKLLYAFQTWTIIWYISRLCLPTLIFRILDGRPFSRGCY